MMNTRAVRGWRQMLANQGFVATVRIARDRVVQRFKANRHSLDVVSEPPADLPAIHPFDEHYSVDTSGLIWGEHLASGSPSDRWSTAYYGIAPSVFSTVMSKIQESLAGAAFIDLGSGKGRAVMLATQLPFSDVIGVELSPALHQVAKSNLAQFRAQVLHEKGQIETKIHLHCMDAARFDFPLQPLVLFMYHPFCKPVLKTVLRRLRQSLVAAPRPRAYRLYQPGAA